jgi:hypothetical protein
VSTNGSLHSFVKTAKNLMDKGYDTIVIIGRGLAVPKTEEIAHILKEFADDFYFELSFN